jgi:hypothetical protein
MTLEQSQAAWDELRELYARLDRDPQRDAKIEKRMEELYTQLGNSPVPLFDDGNGRLQTTPANH